MRTYQLFFLDDHVVGSSDFQAEDDERAVEIAEILFDACSDRCQSWQLWDRDVLLVRGPRGAGAQLQASDLTKHRQENIIRCLEAILRSKWAIVSSARLIAELGKLKASKRDASRYS